MSGAASFMRGGRVVPVGGAPVLAAALGAALAGVALVTAVLAPASGLLLAAGGGPETAMYIPAADVMAAFDRGAVLVNEANYMVHASRRDAAGMAEVHTKDTDIIHVLEGTATMVTGGKVVGGRPTADDEIRGASIEGGAERRLAVGDVVVVPKGMPHWFREVQGPFLYYVVKVR